MEGVAPLASDQAFLDFVRSRISNDTSKHLLAEETIEAILADEGFIRDWRSMLQYKSTDRPSAIEILEKATWIPELVVVTLHAPPPPLNDDSAVVCMGMG